MMRIKITFILCFVSIIFSTVNAWISIGLSYGVCESTFTSDVIHINEKDAQFYTNSTNVRHITSYDETNDGFSLTVIMYGCTPDCGWEFDLIVSSSKQTVTPVKNPCTYTCPGGYTWQVNLKTNVLRIGDTPHPHYPFSFPLAMYYCGNHYNIDNNTKINLQPPIYTNSSLECVIYYSNQDYDVQSYFFDYEEDASQYPYHNQKPAALSLIGTLDNAFTYYRNHYLALKYTLNNISVNLDNHLVDFSPYSAGPADRSIQYDFIGMQNLFQGNICNRLLKVGSVFVDSVPRDYPEYVDQTGAPIGRTVSTTDFYAKVLPCFSIVDNTHTQTFTFDNFQNDLNNYYGVVSNMTKGVPFTMNIDIFTPSSFWLSAPFYQEVGLVNFGTPDIQNILTPFAGTVIASSILKHYGLQYCNWVDQALCNKACVCECVVVTISYACFIQGVYDCDQLIHFNNNCIYGSYLYKPDIMNKITSFVGNTIDLCQNGANGWVLDAGNCEDSSTIRCSGFPNGCNSMDCATIDKGFNICDCNSDCHNHQV